jgi:hypothetical protein
MGLDLIQSWFFYGKNVQQSDENANPVTWKERRIQTIQTMVPKLKEQSSDLNFQYLKGVGAMFLGGVGFPMSAMGRSVCMAFASIGLVIAGPCILGGAFIERRRINNEIKKLESLELRLVNDRFLKYCSEHSHNEISRLEIDQLLSCQKMYEKDLIASIKWQSLRQSYDRLK